MALETPETSSDARRAVAPAADASWRAGFRPGVRARRVRARGHGPPPRARQRVRVRAVAPATRKAIREPRRALRERRAEFRGGADGGAGDRARDSTERDAGRVDGPVRSCGAVVTTDRYVGSPGQTRFIRRGRGCSRKTPISGAETEPIARAEIRRVHARQNRRRVRRLQSLSHETDVLKRAETHEHTTCIHERVCDARHGSSRASNAESFGGAREARRRRRRLGRRVDVFDAGETRDATVATDATTRQNVPRHRHRSSTRSPRSTEKASIAASDGRERGGGRVRASSPSSATGSRRSS